MKKSIRTYSTSFVSVWQSAVNQVLQKENEPAENLSSEHRIMKESCQACDAIDQGEQGEQGGHDLTDCAKLYIQLAWAKLRQDETEISKLEDILKYSTCDPLWVKSLIEFERAKLADQVIPYKRHQTMNDFVIGMNETTSIAFLSDWAAGTETAKQVLREVAKHSPDILIHLGDIYYSGTQHEAKINFLDIIIDILPSKTRVLTLAGNHCMYSGGEGFYWLLKQLGQDASYFCLRNDHWQILGMDTGLLSFNPKTMMKDTTGLDSGEARWHQDKLKNAEGRKNILLSHDQLFTASGGIGKSKEGRNLALNPKLYAVFKDYLNDLSLWLWGHEHNLLLFEPYLGLDKGRCIGSGALPVFVEDNPYVVKQDLATLDNMPLPKLNTDIQLGHNDEIYHHAYALLELEKDKGSLSYFQVKQEGLGELIYKEEL